MITRRSLLVAGLALAPTLLTRRQARAAPIVRTINGRIRLPDGRYLGYADFGIESGPLILYFHGTPGSRLEAALIAEEATAAGVRIISIDRPGMGLSSFQSGRQILHWPADAECVAAALGYGDSAFGVIGTSGGAPYALATLRCVPHRVTHAAIVSGHTPMNAPGVARGNQDHIIELVDRRPRILEAAFRLIIRRLNRSPDRVVERFSRFWAASDRQLLLCNPLHKRALIANLREAVRCGPAGVVADVRLLANYWGFQLNELPPVPSSIWQGGCDPITPPSMGHYFHRQLAGSELTIDPKAGHATMLKWHAPEILARFQ